MMEITMSEVGYCKEVVLLPNICNATTNLCPVDSIELSDFRFSGPLKKNHHGNCKI
jgi:hypothetical protein